MNQRLKEKMEELAKQKKISDSRDYINGFSAAHDLIMADVRRLVEAHKSIIAAKEYGCVEYKNCECWHQYSRQALAEWREKYGDI